MSKQTKIIIFIIFLAAIGALFAFVSTRGAFTINKRNQINDITNGLVGYWSFDGKDTNWRTQKTTDLSGQNNTGTMTSMSTSTSPVPGVVGQGLKFDGSDDYVNLSNVGSGTGDITWAFWIKRKGPQTNYDGIMRYSSTGSPGMIFLNNKVNLATRYTGGAWCGAGITATSALPDEEWIFVVVTSKDGASSHMRTMYIDGIYNTESNCTLGVRADNGGMNFLGSDGASLYSTVSFDEVRIYNRALSGQEIKNLYEQGASKFMTNTSADEMPGNITDGLVGYWSFDGKDMNWASTTAESLDRSGQNNNGDATNMSQKSADGGVVGQGLNFDGVDDYVNLTNNSSLKPSLPVTFTAWVYSNSSQSGGIIMSDSYNADSVGNYYGILMNKNSSDKITCNYGDGTGISVSNRQSKSSTDSINIKQWYFVACVVRGASDMDIYFNAIPQAGTYSGTGGAVVYSSASGRIGEGSANQNFNGTIDEVRIYNRALSGQEIKNLYEQGASKFMTNTSADEMPGNITDGLVGYWSFDGKDMNWASTTAESLDTSGQNNNGDATNMSQKSADGGVVGQALKFDGSDDYVSVADPGTSSLDITGQLTVSAWIYKTGDTSTNGWADIVTKADTDANPANYWMQIIDVSNVEYLDLYMSTGAVSGESRSSNPISLNTWHHVAVTYNDSTNSVVYYINSVPSSGVLIWGTDPKDISTVANDNPLRIGWSYTSQQFPGSIDEVRVYNRALSPQEVKNLYDSTRPN